MPVDRQPSGTFLAKPLKFDRNDYNLRVRTFSFRCGSARFQHLPALVRFSPALWPQASSLETVQFDLPWGSPLRPFRYSKQSSSLTNRRILS